MLQLPEGAPSCHLRLQLILRPCTPCAFVEDDAVEITMRSDNEPLPNNAYVNPKRGSVIVSNRFSRPMLQRDLNLFPPSKCTLSSRLPSEDKTNAHSVNEKGQDMF